MVEGGDASAITPLAHSLTSIMKVVRSSGSWLMAMVESSLDLGFICSSICLQTHTYRVHHHGVIKPQPSLVTLPAAPPHLCMPEKGGGGRSV